MALACGRSRRDAVKQKPPTQAGGVPGPLFPHPAGFGDCAACHGGDRWARTTTVRLVLDGKPVVIPVLPAPIPAPALTGGLWPSQILGHSFLGDVAARRLAEGYLDLILSGPAPTPTPAPPGPPAGLLFPLDDPTSPFAPGGPPGFPGDAPGCAPAADDTEKTPESILDEIEEVFVPS